MATLALKFLADRKVAAFVKVLNDHDIKAIGLNRHLGMYATKLATISVTEHRLGGFAIWQLRTP